MNNTLFQYNDSNQIRISEIKKIETDIAFQGLGIKYVASGEEIYWANGKKFRVQSGEYIIGNDFTQSMVQVDSESAVHGICIDISPEIIGDVAEYHDLNGTELKEFLLSDQFLVIDTISKIQLWVILWVK